jgi:predicted HicB family RNase H-like nuclease
MKDVIIYKDFIGSVHFDSDDETFYGKIEGINDLVTFEGHEVKELKKAFQEAVEDYLSICSDLNKNPHKSFKGSFNIRINPELHRLAYQIATLEGVSLNQLIRDAISHEVNQKKDKLKNAV